jgi:hypothetical protein
MKRVAARRALWQTRRVAVVGLLLVGCVASTNDGASPTTSPELTATPSSPAVGLTTSSPVSVFPSLDPPSATLFLPDEFVPNLSSVSPDGRFVAARARNWGRVALYRITRPLPRASLLQLTPVGEVRGFVDQLSWLEDSSAVLVGTDLDPTHTLQNHDPSNQGRRLAILNTDGRVVIAPETAREALYHRAHASPDGRWIPVADRCCGLEVLLLSRDGGEARRVVPPAPAGVSVGFAGWDRDGLLLYWEIAGGRSVLVAVDLGGSERYRISAPNDFGAVGWGIVASAPDRSWQLVELSGGMGSSFRATRLLVGRDLRSVPDRLDESPYGPFALGDELVYGDGTGTLRAYQPSSGRVRDLPLRLDPSRGLTTIGVSDGYFMWTELIHGYVADVETGRRVSLPLQRILNVSIVEGARLAEYHFDDNAIVIFDLATIAKQ